MKKLSEYDSKNVAGWNFGFKFGGEKQICNVLTNKQHENYYQVNHIDKNKTSVKKMPRLIVCTPPKSGTTNWSKVLWQLKYLNELGILVDKNDKNYINFTNLYKEWFENSEKICNLSHFYVIS